MHPSYMPPMKKARVLLGLTQLELGKKCNLARWKIWAIEKGAQKPTAEDKKAIAKALNEPIKTIFPRD